MGCAAAQSAARGRRPVTARVDVEEEETMKAAVDVVMREVGRLDFMANVSAVLSDGKMRPETSIARTEAANMTRVRGERGGAYDDDEAFLAVDAENGGEERDGGWWGTRSGDRELVGAREQRRG